MEGHKTSPGAAHESSDGRWPQRKHARVVWNPELQARFVKTYQELGTGAVPKSILEVCIVLHKYSFRVMSVRETHYLLLSSVIQCLCLAQLIMAEIQYE